MGIVQVGTIFWGNIPATEKGNVLGSFLQIEILHTESKFWHRFKQILACFLFIVCCMYVIMEDHILYGENSVISFINH